MVDSNTLRNISSVASLGVTDRDMRLLKDLISISRNLKDKFRYIDDPDFLKIDILFVNSEDENAMEFYAEYGEHMRCVPVFLFDGKNEEGESLPFLSKFPNAKSLSTPITLVGLTTTMLEIVSAKKVLTNPEPSLSKKVGCFKILVVDDSFPVRKYLQEKLPLLIAEIDSRLGFEIEFAASGREAVNKVKEARGAYDIVFLDIMMEDIDGYQICKWIKKVKRSINVVLLTSKSSPIDRMRGNLSGCDNYLSKPPKDSHLKKVIMNHRKLSKKTTTTQSQLIEANAK
jgi:twitching motility two-component system response regulator PilG